MDGLAFCVFFGYRAIHETMRGEKAEAEQVDARVCVSKLKTLGQCGNWVVSVRLLFEKRSALGGCDISGVFASGGYSGIPGFSVSVLLRFHGRSAPGG